MTTIELLKKMIAFKPVNSEVKNVNRLVDYLEKYLAKHGVYTRVETFAGRRILYAATIKTRTPALLFNAHLDVVPAAEKMFHAKERRGWIMGRGTGDCLGNAAITVQALIACHGTTDAGCIFSTDEETGGNTTKFMLDNGYRGKLIVVVDGAGNKIAIAQKGILTLKLSARGKSCHGARPWLGRNAIDLLIEGYRKIKTIFPEVKAGDEWHNTISANIIKGGAVFNQVPDYAEMFLDIRYINTTKPAKLARRIRSKSGLQVKIEALDPVVFSCDATLPIIREFKHFLSEKLGRKIQTIRSNGATDARHFISLKRPIVMIGIPSQGNHSSDERAYVKDMLKYQDILKALCLEGLPELRKTS